MNTIASVKLALKVNNNLSKRYLPYTSQNLRGEYGCTVMILYVVIIRAKHLL
jgi:hypothetical protein